jgi:hypothetical protein
VRAGTSVGEPLLFPTADLAVDYEYESNGALPGLVVDEVDLVTTVLSFKLEAREELSSEQKAREQLKRSKTGAIRDKYEVIPLKFLEVLDESRWYSYSGHEPDSGRPRTLLTDAGFVCEAISTAHRVGRFEPHRFGIIAEDVVSAGGTAPLETTSDGGGCGGDGDAVQRNANLQVASELLQAIQSDDAATIKLILERPSPDETSGTFVPIKKRGGGVALQSCFPSEWGLLDLDPADWKARLKTMQAYMQGQLDSARGQVEQLQQEAAALDGTRGSYEAATKSITGDPNFGMLVETLDGVKTRVDSRNGGVKAVQRSSDIREVFRDAKAVVQKYTTLLEELQKMTRCKCKVAPCKKVFRCLEKIGLDPEHQWDAKTLSDVVRGTAEMGADAGMGGGLQLVQLLMAVDRGDPPEATHSPYDESGGPKIMDALGDSIVIVGVKNRWKEDADGWRDAQIKFYFASDTTKHICELQLVHPLLMNVRSSMGLHAKYAKSRNACELLEAISEPLTVHP